MEVYFVVFTYFLNRRTGLVEETVEWGLQLISQGNIEQETITKTIPLTSCFPGVWEMAISDYWFEIQVMANPVEIIINNLWSIY